MTTSFREPGSVYAYHVMRGAAERFAKDVSTLDEAELVGAREQADRTYALESLVLASEEAQQVIVVPEHVDAAVATLVARYPSRSAFVSGLDAHGLTETQLREALYRELQFDGVMEVVAAGGRAASKTDARRYYELHRDRFTLPERRRARHILVTINDAIEDNRRDIARRRIERLASDLASEPGRFSEYASRHSECPSALDGGSLGDIARGQLYPALEAVLFRMEEATLSEVIETEVGYHLLWLEKCIAAAATPFAAVEGRIRHALDARRRRHRQEAFLQRLRDGRVLTDDGARGAVLFLQSDAV